MSAAAAAATLHLERAHIHRRFSVASNDGGSTRARIWQQTIQERKSSSPII
jgi:hypothetical protein